MQTTIERPKQKNPAEAAEFFRKKLMYEITPHDLKAELEDPTALLLDVRDRESYRKEHIPKAVNVPLEELEKTLDRLPRDKEVITYCWNLTCALATKAALRLAERGFLVKEALGGIGEWKKKGFPVESQP